MTKRRLIRTFAREAGLPLGKAEKYVDLLLSTIKDATWQERECSIAGFGIFRLTRHKDKVAIDPMDRELVHVSIGGDRVKFKASSVWSGVDKDKLKELN